jgi:SAM-dependent methyltransferase
MSGLLYERIGRGYTVTRRADPRIARAVHAALGDAASVVNVGAGAGAYEPSDRQVIAIEPSARMRAQRPVDAAPCLDAVAEQLPLADDSVDVAMAVYTDFHWHDRAQGIAELRRVSRRGVVLLTVDRDAAAGYWLTRDYVPAANDLFAPLAAVTECLPGPAPQITPVPVPADCHDGFVHAYWRRPQALLRPDVRSTMAMFARLPADTVSSAQARLRADLESGAWYERNQDLADRSELDLGHRLVVWRPETASGA